MNQHFNNFLHKTITNSLNKLNSLDQSVFYTTSFHEPTNSLVLSKYTRVENESILDFKMEIPKYRVREVLENLIQQQSAER